MRPVGWLPLQALLKLVQRPPPRPGQLALEMHLESAAGLKPAARPTPGLLAAFGRALAAHGHAGGTAPWSHRCPWAAEIRLVPADVATQGEAA